MGRSRAVVLGYMFWDTSATVCINAATGAESLLKGTKFVL
jgi:hypothetical protein